MTRERWGRKEQGRRESAVDGVNEAEETKVTSTERRKKRRACAALHRSTATGAFRFEHACSKHSAYLLNISGLQQFITIYYRHTSPVKHANAIRTACDPHRLRA